MAASSPSPPAKYGALLSAFSFYGAYHADVVNQRIHAVFVPAILGSALLFATQVPLRVPPAAAAALGLPAAAAAAVVSAADVAAPAYALYYVVLTARGGLPLVGLGAGAGVIALWRGASALVAARGFAAVWRPALALHVASWLAQFYGHGVHEGRAPALLDNLFQARVTAPLFVFVEGLFAAGLLKDFKRASDAEVAKLLAKFRAGKAGAGGGGAAAGAK